jgi:hypothetical protein
VPYSICSAVCWGGILHISFKRDNVVRKLECRGKFLHIRNYTHLSLIKLLFLETLGKNRSQVWKIQYVHGSSTDTATCIPQLKEWYTGEGKHELSGRKIQSWRGIMGLYLMSCTSNNETFIMELWCRWTKLLVTHTDVFMKFCPKLNTALYLC